MDTEVRGELLDGWRQHLISAEPDIRQDFFKTTLLPYWKWCGRQQFFSNPSANQERLAFWELLPYSSSAFPEAVKIAINLAPAKIEHSRFVLEELYKAASKVDSEILVGFLIKMLEVDIHPQWRRDEWQAAWEAVKNHDSPKLAVFRDNLAKRGVGD